jgi:cytochrome c-type biogenesis protein CcmH
MNFSENAQKISSTRKFWLLLIVVLMALAGVGYWMLGRDSGKTLAPSHSGADIAATPGQAAASKSSNSLPSLSDEQLERMVVQAKAQTQQDAKNAPAWAMLAHSYEMMGKFSEAANAYARLLPLLPKDAQVRADYADVLAVTKGRSFQGEPIALLKQALTLDPKNVKALFLTGSAYIEQQDAKQAMVYFEKARAATTNAALLVQIDAGVAQAKVLSNPAPAASGAASAAATPALAKAVVPVLAPGTTAQVSGRVWLAEDLRAKTPAEASLFLLALPVDGSRMPVAVLRKKVSDLPFNFVLDDSMSMVANAGLSKQSQVVVVARISLRGNVTPAVGDLEGVSAPVVVGSKDLKLEITEVLK